MDGREGESAECDGVKQRERERDGVIKKVREGERAPDGEAQGNTSFS